MYVVVLANEYDSLESRFSIRKILGPFETESEAYECLGRLAEHNNLGEVWECTEPEDEFKPKRCKCHSKIKARS